MSFVVKALSPGYYGTRRRKGDTFPVAEEEDFSARWMERVEQIAEVEQAEAKPKKVTKKTAKKQK